MPRLTPVIAVVLTLAACAEPLDTGPGAVTSSSAPGATSVDTTEPDQSETVTTQATDPSPAPTGSHPATTTAPPTEEEGPVSDPDTPIVGEVPVGMLRLVLDDASERTGVPVDSLSVVRGEAVVWNDGSLGCPEPGVFYTQALVDGYWVEIDARGEMLDYRLTSNGTFRLCEAGSSGSTSPSPGAGLV